MILIYTYKKYKPKTLKYLQMDTSDNSLYVRVNDYLRSASACITFRYYFSCLGEMYILILITEINNVGPFLRTRSGNSI